MSRAGDLVRRFTRRRRAARRQSWFESIERAAGIDDYFAFNGVAYSGTPIEFPMNQAHERIDADFTGLVRDGLKGNSVIWSCERLRLKVFSQLRFMFQEMDDGRPGELHNRPGTRLAELDQPWKGGTTFDLLARMRLHSDFGGTAFVVRSTNGTGLRCLRPDWVTMVLGSDGQPGDPNEVDTELICIGYWPGGFQHCSRNDIPADVFMASEVCVFAPMPDPTAHYRGMSWLNPVITEFYADTAATNHKLQFFRNGATLQTVVMVDKDIDESAFKRFMSKINAETKGVANAYKTLFVTGGVDVKVVGADLRQLDFKITQGAGETRVAAAAGTPPILVGLSEGLNAGQYNIYGQAKRSFVDGEIRPDWMNLCGSMSNIVTPPGGSRLWYDDRDIAYLREDQKDVAEILHLQASAVQILLNAGWKPDPALRAIITGDMMVLEGQHSGLYSVQLLPPSDGTMNTPPPIPAIAEVGSPPQLNGKPPAAGLPAGRTPPPTGKPTAAIGAK